MDDPRYTTPTNPPWTRDGRNMGLLNRSVDPLNAGNHILENTMFRPQMVTYVPAPANHVAGPIEFSFDFFYDDWDTAAHSEPHDANNDHYALVRLYGVNTLPAHGSSLFNGNVMDPTVDDPTADLLTEFRWGGSYTDPSWTDGDSTGGWITLDSDNPGDLNWSEGGGVLSTSVSTPFNYYALQITSITYSEASVLFWASVGSGDIVPTFSQGFDNFNLQVTVPEPGTAAVLMLVGAGLLGRKRR